MALETPHTKKEIELLDLLIDFTLNTDKSLDKDVSKVLLETKQVILNRKKQLHFYTGNVNNTFTDYSYTIKEGVTTKSEIIEDISKMYNTAKQMPSKTFKVAYDSKADEQIRSDYTNKELVTMFLAAGDIPDNVYFSRKWEEMIRIKD